MEAFLSQKFGDILKSSSFPNGFMAFMASAKLQNITSFRGPSGAQCWPHARVFSAFVLISSGLRGFWLLTFGVIAFNLCLDKNIKASMSSNLEKDWVLYSLFFQLVQCQKWEKKSHPTKTK